MPDRIIRESFAIICEDGSVAQDRHGEDLDYFTVRGTAEHMAAKSPWLKESKRGPFRVARIQVIEKEEV